jgi:hypothetical protein
MALDCIARTACLWLSQSHHLLIDYCTLECFLLSIRHIASFQGLHQGCQNLFNSYWAVQCRPRSTSLSRLNQPEQFCRVLFVWSRFAIVQFKDEIHTPCSPEERILSLFPVFFCSFRVRQLLCMSPLGNIQHDLFQPLNSGNPCILQNRRDRECDRRCRTRARICSHT